MSANVRKALPWIAATAVVALTAVLLLREEPDAPRPAEEAAAPAPAPQPRPLASPPPAEAFASPAPGLEAVAGALPPPLPAQVPEPEEGPPKPYPVDLERLREKLPGNLYWEVAAPTKDPEVLKKREAEARRWNEQYGKVLSGTATEAEVREYYAYRKKLSEDFLAFATTVLDEYGGELPERDLGLYQLSIDMHRTRLAELPRQEADSLAHREAQQRRREAWRQGQSTP
jgi:type IV secretory pathway VirB10-like protein